MASQQQSQGANVLGESILKVDPRSPLWQYVEIIGKNPGGGSYKWKCSECNDIQNGSYTRVKGHLTRQTNTGVLICNGPNGLNGQPGPGLSPEKFAF